MRGIEDRLYELVGQTIKVNTPILTGTATMMRKEKFLVLQAFPWHVLCERTCNNGAVIRESFDVGTLVINGIIEGNFAKTYYKHLHNGWKL